jgi:FlaA1/EpsC-like NDP-sugar epimerase
MKAVKHDRSQKADRAEGEVKPEVRPPAAGAMDPWSAGFWSALLQNVRRRARNYCKLRVWLMAIIHLAVFAAVYWIAFLLRFDFDIKPGDMKVFWATLPWVLAIKFAVFLIAGQYDGWWTYVTFSDLVALVRYALAVTLIIGSGQYFLGLGFYIPRSVIVIDCLGSIALLGAMRGTWRLYREQFWPILNPSNFRWALMVGTDHATGLLANQMQSYRELPYRVRGLLALDAASVGSRLGQIPVLGRLEDVREVAAACAASTVLVTAGSLAGSYLRNLMDACKQSGLELKIIRPIQDRMGGDHRIPIRDIEISDLLRRAPVQLDMNIIGRLVEGRTVMVTGAGGSIGSEICRQLLKFNPGSLLLVGRGENRIFKVERKLRTAHSAAVLRSCIADVTDEARLRQLFEQYRPEVVFHAAAHKHVPLMESNVGEAIRNNVGGTKVIAELSHEFGVRNFVFISTDKAVHPTSIMGVSKQIAERFVHAMSQASSTCFTVVRFGNVLGSDGSVVPIFQDQIRRGGPITVTDPRMTRFFMTIPEASQLVLQAAAMGMGGEIFVLEMGEPIKIVDLARDLVRLSGLPEDSIEICFTGIRPGEKLYEELYFDDEETLPTAHPKLRAAYHRPYTLAEVSETIAHLEKLVHAPEEEIRQKLCEVVEEYAWQVRNADGGLPHETAPQSEPHSSGRVAAGTVPPSIVTPGIVTPGIVTPGVLAPGSNGNGKGPPESRETGASRSTRGAQ